MPLKKQCEFSTIHDEKHALMDAFHLRRGKANKPHEENRPTLA